MNDDGDPATATATQPLRKGRSNALRPVTKQVIWARGAGRCYICNAELIGDLVSGNENANFGFVAHIVADAPGGPRGDQVRSPALADDPANLMLLCHPHHKLIDVDEVEAYPEARLVTIKREHERRIAIVVDIPANRASHVLRYAANIGVHHQLIPYEGLASAMSPDRYPADGRATVDIQMKGSSLQDGEAAFWSIERTNLERQFGTKVRERIEAGSVHHMSVFAIAPQPLLMLFGALLGDITPTDVYQLHREPPGWSWPSSGPAMRLELIEPSDVTGPIALKIGLSATVGDDRIRAVLGADVSIWALRAVDPHNDVLKSRDDLRAYRSLLRRTYDRIKARHGQDRVINVFPAMPVSAAVETGRVWMPKADLPLAVFDENRILGGFREALVIGDDPRRL